MLEMYRAGTDHRGIMEDLEQAVEAGARALQPGRSATLAGAAERSTGRRPSTGCGSRRPSPGPAWTWRPAGRTPAGCAPPPGPAGLDAGPEGEGFDDVFFRIFLQAVEPGLGHFTSRVPDRLAGLDGRALPHPPGRPALGRALRALRRRARARQRLLRAQRRRRAATPPARRSGRCGSARAVPPTRSTSASWRRWGGCPTRAGWRSGSTGCSCCSPAPRASATCCSSRPRTSSRNPERPGT